MNTRARRGLRGIARVAAFVVAIPAMVIGALLALAALYALANGTPSVVGRGAPVQALSALVFLALVMGGVRLLVFATNAQSAREFAKQQPAADTEDTREGPLSGRERIARVESRVGLAVSALGLGLLVLALAMRWDVWPIAGILLIVHGGLVSIAGRALARAGAVAWLAQALPVGFFAIWRLIYCAEALLDRCP